MLGNILSVTSNFPRWEGDSTTPFVLHLAQDLQKLGWEITVLAPHAPGCALTESIQGVQVERFRYLWPESAETVCYQGGALINLRKNRLNYAKLPSLVISEFLGILSRLKNKPFDLLHTHWLLPQGLTGVVASSLMKTPHITTIHGGDVFSLNGRMLNKIKRVALEKVDYVTVNSPATLQAVEKLLPGIKNVATIPMGIALPDSNILNDSTNIRNKWRVGNGPLLIFIGRLVAEKGIDDIIDASSTLLQDFPDIRVLIVGEGQDKSRFQAKAAALNLDGHIHFTGWLAPEQIPAYLKSADIFIGPSRKAKDGWQEAQGLTFLESMAAKTPVIATRVGGITDIVKHEATGLLVEQNRPDQIALAVKKILSDPRLKTKIIKDGFQLSRQFTRESSAAAFSGLFSNIISARSSVFHPIQ